MHCPICDQKMEFKGFAPDGRPYPCDVCQEVIDDALRDFENEEEQVDDDA